MKTLSTSVRLNPNDVTVLKKGLVYYLEQYMKSCMYTDWEGWKNMMEDEVNLLQSFINIGEFPSRLELCPDFNDGSKWPRDYTNAWEWAEKRFEDFKLEEFVEKHGDTPVETASSPTAPSPTATQVRESTPEVAN